MSNGGLERNTGVEPAFAAWEAAVLPMDQSRICARHPTQASLSLPAALIPSTVGRGRYLERTAGRMHRNRPVAAAAGVGPAWTRVCQPHPHPCAAILPVFPGCQPIVASCPSPPDYPSSRSSDCSKWPSASHHPTG